MKIIIYVSIVEGNSSVEDALRWREDVLLMSSVVIVESSISSQKEEI